jgi:predicted nucleic acid-binding protein
MFVLDTNVVSELRKARSGKADAGVVGWAEAVPASLMFLSAATVQELEHGVLLAERNNPPAGALLRAWLDHYVLPTFAERVLPVDEDVATQAAAFHVPDPAPVLDALIGASAVVHGMKLVTRNTADFERFDGLTVVNPWSQARVVS